jgi:hypothetical protein
MVAGLGSKVKRVFHYILVVVVKPYNSWDIERCYLARGPSRGTHWSHSTLPGMLVDATSGDDDDGLTDYTQTAWTALG